jgi:hypothetical protein
MPDYCQKPGGLWLEEFRNIPSVFESTANVMIRGISGGICLAYA